MPICTLAPPRPTSALRIDTDASDPSSEEVSDDQLMAQVQAGDDGALKQLYAKHAGHLRGVAGRVLHAEPDVDEVLQDVFIDLWKRADRYVASRGKVVTWLCILARRRAIDRCRHRQHLDRTEDNFRRHNLHVPAESDRKHGADEAAQASDRTQMLMRILKTLPEPQRAVMQMSYYGCMSQREIAKKTGIPLGTVKTRLELGLRKVRAAVMERGGAEAWTTLHG